MIFSDRNVGFGMVVMGCVVQLQGLAQLFSGQLLFTGQGKHPWLRGFFAVFGDHAVAASVLFYFLLGASFIFMGCNLIKRYRRDRA